MGWPSGRRWPISAPQCTKAKNDPPGGSFFAFVHCGALIGHLRPDGQPIASDTDLTEWLLESEGVAAVDGGAYGLSPYFRISTAASDEAPAQATARIARAVAALKEIGRAHV